MDPNSFEVSVVGGGLVGLGVARSLQRRYPGLGIGILEKEAGVGRHQSTHNSGVLHAGLYYKPGSLKARMAVEGIRMMTQFCREHAVPHEICGKVVVAVDDVELARLRELHDRGIRNGLAGLRWLEGDALRELEPNVAGIAGLHVPEEGIVDYRAVCDALRADFERLGGQVITSAEVQRLRRLHKGWEIGTTRGNFVSGFLVNCAGLFCDRIAQWAGVRHEVRIIPFRGEYFTLAGEAQGLVRNLIYPVPDPSFPFLGVHFTRLIHGGVEAGPNAVLALAREGYSKWDVSAHDLREILGFEGIWSFLARHRGMCVMELARSMSKTLFTKSLQRLVPDVQKSHLLPGGAGVRAQAMLRDGTLVNDFWIEQTENALHVLNAPSPAATASLAIGEEVAGRIHLRNRSM